PLYMSPEAILTGTVDARADIYGLGALAYYLVTGQTVFDGRSVVEVCAEHLSVTPRPPSTRVTFPVPAVIDELILRCLEKKPEQRYAGAAELAQKLRAAALEVGTWSEETARLWWKERGRPLLDEIRSKQRVRLRNDDGREVTMAVAARSEHDSGTVRAGPISSGARQEA
ncbi:MAG TPA: hypothetical protein VGK73_17975, partial [Polyangiaceae bacterium]